MFGLTHHQIGQPWRNPISTINTCMLYLYQNMNITSWVDNLIDTETLLQGMVIKFHKYYQELKEFHRNWYIWDPSTNRYEDHGVSMRRPHYQGAFTRIPEDAMVLRDCKLNQGRTKLLTTIILPLSTIELLLGTINKKFQSMQIIQLYHYGRIVIHKC